MSCTMADLFMISRYAKAMIQFNVTGSISVKITMAIHAGSHLSISAHALMEIP